ncbi:hypothetical protein GCM10027160_02410 [Streptomyces calidiresistens]
MSPQTTTENVRDSVTRRARPAVVPRHPVGALSTVTVKSALPRAAPSPVRPRGGTGPFPGAVTENAHKIIQARDPTSGDPDGRGKCLVSQGGWPNPPGSGGARGVGSGGPVARRARNGPATPGGRTVVVKP